MGDALARCSRGRGRAVPPDEAIGGRGTPRGTRIPRWAPQPLRGARRRRGARAGDGDVGRLSRGSKDKVVRPDEVGRKGGDSCWSGFSKRNEPKWPSGNPERRGWSYAD